MVHLSIDKSKDGRYKIHVSRKDGYDTRTIEAVISTASKVTILTYRDLAKLLDRKPATVLKMIRSNELTEVGGYKYIACKLKDIEFEGQQVEAFYFLLTGSDSVESVIGLDVINNCEVSLRHDTMELGYFKETSYEYDFKEVANTNIVNAAKKIGDDCKSISMIFDDATGDK